MQILKMHNLTQNYRINLAARGILQSHGTLRHMTDESNNGIDYRESKYIVNTARFQVLVHVATRTAVLYM